MNSKLIAIAVIAFFVGYWIAPEVTVVEVDNETKWCFYAEYGDIDNFEATQSPAKSFISIKGSEYRVFAPCETFDWYEKAKGH